MACDSNTIRSLPVSLITFFRDPSWQKVHAGMLLAACGGFGLAALRIKHIRDLRNRYLVKQVTAAYARFPGHPLSSRRYTVRNTTVAALCVVVSVIGCAVALRNYIILSNWDEGSQRDSIGDHIGAIICYKKALRIDSGLRRTHCLIGQSLLVSGRPSTAIPELKAAVRDEKSDSDPAATLGDAYQVLGRYSEAIDAYKSALAIDANNSRYEIGLGTCYEKMEMLTLAYRAYERAIASDAKNVNAHIKLGVLLVRTGNINEGIGHCRRAAALAPTSSLAHYCLAEALVRVARYQSAVTEYKDAIAYEPKWIMPHYNLGVTLERIHEPELALDEYKACMKLEVHSEEERYAIRTARIAAMRLSREKP